MNQNESLPLYIQLTETYVPAWGCGGPVRLMYDYAQWLSSGFQVMVHTTDAHHDFTRIPVRCEIIGGVSVYRHKFFFAALARRSAFVISPTMLIQAAKQIYRARRPVIVHFSLFRGPVPITAMLLKLLFRKRVTLVHSAFGSLYYKRAIHRQIYDALFMKSFVRLVDLRLVQNDHEGEAYNRICLENGANGQSQIVLFPLSLDGIPPNPTRFTDSGKNHAAVLELRRTLGVPEDALVFVFLGRLHPSKGILRMIDAFLEFSQSCSRETLLLVVGHDFGFQRNIEQYILSKGIESKVRIINNVYETRFDYYFLADVFLGFPTIFEETMLASIEAMACGTPIVVSREADAPFVEEARAGRVIDFDPSAAARAMADVVENLPMFQANARRVAASCFDGAAASKNLRALFCKAISGNLSSETPTETGAVGRQGLPRNISQHERLVSSRSESRDPA